MEVKLSGMKHEVVGVREQRLRRALLGFAVLVTFAAFILITTTWLFVSAWARRTDISDFDRASPAAASYPMQLGPLIAGNNKATAGEFVYLARVVLKPGPTPRTFFLAGSQGTQILTMAEGAHIGATPVQIVDVRGTIRSVPPVAVLRKQWNLSTVDAKSVSQLPIYIEAHLIEESGD